MADVYMGQIMAECDCRHQACAARGYCMAARIAALEAERDALVEALEETADAFAQSIGQRRHKGWIAIRNARAALAKIKETDNG